MSEVEIVYQQRGIVVLNKPPGVLTQAPPGIDSLELRLRQFIAKRDEIEGKFYLTPIHRLDRPVSGAIAFARNVRAAKRVSAQFQQRTIEKFYHAWVTGKMPDSEGLLEDSMRKMPEEARSEIVSADHADAKAAALRYRVLERRGDATRVEIELLTGRTHQIRLQFASRGHAIWGDELYGSSVSFGPQTVDLRQRQIALHAAKLKFRHPIDEEDVEVSIEPPWDAAISNEQ